MNKLTPTQAKILADAKANVAARSKASADANKLVADFTAMTVSPARATSRASRAPALNSNKLQLVSTGQQRSKKDNAERRKALKATHGIGNECAKYLSSLIDPFSVNDARIPQRCSAPSSTFSVTQTIKLSSDASGRACFLLAGGIMQHYAATRRTVPADSNASTYLHAYNSNHTSGAGALIEMYPNNHTTFNGYYDGSVAGDSVPGYMINSFCGAAEAGAIVQAFTAYRKVSMGFKVKYTGSIVNAQGSVCLARIPGSFQFRTDAPTIPVDPQFGMGPTALAALNYDSITQLEDAAVYSAVEGGTITWSPSGDSVDEWRPLKYVPPFAVDWTVYGGLGVEPTAYVMPCDSSPQEYKAYANQFNYGVLNAMYAAASLPVPGTPSIVDITNSINNNFGLMHAVDDPYLIAIFSGLPASVSDLITVEWVVNYEAIPDERTWSLATPLAPMSSEGPELARAVVASMPASHPGSEHSGFASKIAGIATKAYAGIKTALSAGRAIAPHAGDLLSSIGMEDAGSVVSQLGGVESLAELGALLL